nr:5505_t:CDS:1 [Entrophospora candida]
MGFRRFAAFGPVLLANPYFLYNIRVTLKYTIPNITYSTSLSTFYPKRGLLYNFNRDLTTTTTSNTIGLENNNNNNINNFKVDPDDPIVTRISQDPKLMASIQEFSEILKSKGIDLGKRQMPSMLQMAKLATDGQVKQKLINLNKELKSAGIELNTETVQKYMTFVPQGMEKPTYKTPLDNSENIYESPKSVTTKIQSSPTTLSPTPSPPIPIHPPQPPTSQPNENSKVTSPTPTPTPTKSSISATKQKTTKKLKQESAISTKESAPKQKYQAPKQPEKIASETTEKLKEEQEPVGLLSRIKSFFKFKK